MGAGRSGLEQGGAARGGLAGESGGGSARGASEVEGLTCCRQREIKISARAWAVDAAGWGREI